MNRSRVPADGERDMMLERGKAQLLYRAFAHFLERLPFKRKDDETLCVCFKHSFNPTPP
jgi:hypothetical protein